MHAVETLTMFQANLNFVPKLMALSKTFFAGHLMRCMTILLCFGLSVYLRESIKCLADSRKLAVVYKLTGT